MQMGMEKVFAIITGLGAAGAISSMAAALLYCDVGSGDERRPAWRRGMTWLTGVLAVVSFASCIVCTAELEMNIDVEEIDEPVIVESRRIIEGGFDVQTVTRQTGGMLMTGDLIIPTSSEWTDVRYIVMCESGGGVKTLEFGASSVPVQEDAGTWEDARIETVETAVERYTGTFFGVRVEDTKVEGRLSPDYVIHVPEGTLAERIGE